MLAEVRLPAVLIEARVGGLVVRNQLVQSPVVHLALRRNLHTHAEPALLGARAGVALVVLIAVNQTLHQLCILAPHACLAQPEAHHLCMAWCNGRLAPVASLLHLQIIVFTVRANVLAVTWHATARLHVHQVCVHVADVLNVWPPVHTRHLQRARSQQLCQVLQDPGPVLVQEPMAEALRVHGLQLQPLLLQVVIDLANGQLGGNVIGQRAGDATQLPQAEHIGEEEEDSSEELYHVVGEDDDEIRHLVTEQVVADAHVDGDADHTHENGKGKEGHDKVVLRREAQQVR